MNILSKFLAVILILSLISCSTVPLQLPQMAQMRYRMGTQDQYSLNRSMLYPSGQQWWFDESSDEYNQLISFWTGDGGKGKSITILPPMGIGLSEDQAYLPDLVANELVSNFSNYSDMTLFDRVNNQRQYDELLSGYYSDDDTAGMDLGHLESTDYMLLGSITRTTTGYVLQLTVNRNRDKTTMASYSGTISIIELDNLTGIRRASLDLLPKLGVQLTDLARAELTGAASNDHINAQTALAQGINAQRQGTEVAALTYYFQAAAFDASLVEAVNRTNILSANISTGNIGANVRNDIAWRRDWVDKLTETETLINDMLRNTDPQRSIWYTTNIREHEPARNYSRETTELRIEAVLHTHAVFPVSIQKTVQAVYDGLQTTGRVQEWGLNNWPRQGVTNNNPFNYRWGSAVSINFELLDDRNQVIGRQTVNMDSRFSFYGTQLNGPETVYTTVRFTDVNANNITDRMSIHIASINGQPPEKAGISQIRPITEQRMSANKMFRIYNGEIRPSTNHGDLGTVNIPAELWGERVTVIPDNAFERRGISRVNIPEGVTTIGRRAFADNTWTTNERQNDGTYSNRRYGLWRVVLPSSVITIREEAFYSHWTTTSYSDGRTTTNNYWLVTEVTIGSNVILGNNAFGIDFESYYNNSNKQAGTYRRSSLSSTRWERFNTREEMQQEVEARRQAAEERERRTNNVLTTIGWIAGIACSIYSVLAITGVVSWPSFSD